MTIPVDRRSFVSFIAGLIPGYKLFPFYKFNANDLTPAQSPGQATRTYVCPPCGQKCDKLIFDSYQNPTRPPRLWI